MVAEKREHRKSARTDQGASLADIKLGQENSSQLLCVGAMRDANGYAGCRRFISVKVHSTCHELKQISLISDRNPL